MIEEIISSIDNLSQFIQSSIHIDYINEINIRVKETQGLLEDPEGVYKGKDYDLFRGRIKNLREMADLFINMRDTLEDDNDT